MPEQNPTLQIKHICLKIKTVLDINNVIEQIRNRLTTMSVGEFSLANPNTFIVIYNIPNNEYYFFIVFDGKNITYRTNSFLNNFNSSDTKVSLYKNGRYDIFTLMTSLLQDTDYKLIKAPK